MYSFIIHNTQDLNRKASFLKEFGEQGITNYEVIPAIMVPKMARRGISQSHKKCVQTAKDRNYPHVHIMEDDVWFLQKGAYKRFLDIYEKEFPLDGDIFFSGNYDGKFEPLTNRLAFASGKKAGMFCYIIPSRFYDTFLAADENYNIDHFLTAPELGNAKCYTCYPFVALQHDGFSYNTGNITNYNPYIHTVYKLWDGLTP